MNFLSFFCFFLIIKCRNCFNNNLSICNSNRTLVLLHENKLRDHLQESSTPLESKDLLEASGVVLTPDGLVVYVIFDNTYEIGLFCTLRGVKNGNCTNKLLDWPDRTLHKVKSEFEGVAYNKLSDTYFVIQETIPSPYEPKEFVSNIFELKITPNHLTKPIEIIESCLVMWKLISTNKGFEGLEFVTHEKTKKNYLLALCEGNDCTTAVFNGDEIVNLGKGRIVVLEKNSTDKDCRWVPVGVIHLPESLRFLDYSALTMHVHHSVRYMAITSQESSQLWIGVLEEIEEAPYFRFLPTKEQNIYDFPRQISINNDCQIDYCNIEGIEWLNEKEFIFISDASKNILKSECTTHSESIHYFMLP